MGAATLGELKYLAVLFSNLYYFCWLDNKMGTSQVEDAIMPPSPLSSSGPLACGYIQQNSHHHSLLDTLVI